MNSDAYENCEIDYDPDDDGCCHDDYDIDTLEGRCHCYRCGESWSATDAEILHAIDSEAAYALWEDEENRRQWWRDLWDRIAAPFRQLRQRQRRLPDTGDDIPF